MIRTGLCDPLSSSGAGTSEQISGLGLVAVRIVVLTEEAISVTVCTVGVLGNPELERAEPRMTSDRPGK